MSLAFIQTLAFISYCSPIQDRIASASISVYEFDSMARGQHIYKCVWIPPNDKHISVSYRKTANTTNTL